MSSWWWLKIIQGSPRPTWAVLIPGKICPRCGGFAHGIDILSTWSTGETHHCIISDSHISSDFNLHQMSAYVTRFHHISQGVMTNHISFRDRWGFPLTHFKGYLLWESTRHHVIIGISLHMAHLGPIWQNLRERWSDSFHFKTYHHCCVSGAGCYWGVGEMELWGRLFETAVFFFSMLFMRKKLD